MNNTSVPKYAQVVNLDSSHFRKLDLSDFVSIPTAPRIAEDEIYYISHGEWNRIVREFLHSQEHPDPDNQFKNSNHWEDVIEGHIGTLHDRHIVTDAFVEGSEFSPREDLEGIYAVKLSALEPLTPEA